MCGQWPARGEVHLERAYQTLQVARHDPGRGIRIDTGQHPMQTFGSFASRDSLESCPKHIVGAWTGKKSARQRAVVEPSPANENRQLAVRVHVANHTIGVM